MTTTRERRVLFVANDGLGAGHVTRALAVGQALAEHLRERGRGVRWMLATTSEADALLRSSEAAVLRLPSTGATRRQGMALSAYRTLQHETVGGLLAGFSPDLLVVDTFPAGPHLELMGLIERVPRRVLIQRSVASSAQRSPEMTTARGLYHATIVPGDPGPWGCPWRGTLAVPPIVLASPMLPRAEARRALGLLPDERVALLNPGGGGDAEALAQAAALEPLLARRGYRTLLARGPLAPGPTAPCPLWPYLSAFDVAVAAAGYNSAHELAAAGVRTALFARPRPFDDQAQRARRFEHAGLAVALDGRPFEEALDRMENMTPPRLLAGGAAAAAAHLGALLLGDP